MDTVLSEVYSQWVEIPDSTGQFMGLQLPGVAQPANLFEKSPAPLGSFPDKIPGKHTIEIYNLQGILIWRGSFSRFESAIFDQWPLAPGIYVAVTKTTDGQILEIKKKIIVHQ